MTKDFETVTFVPAQPGFAIVQEWGATADKIWFQHTPVVAWKMTVGYLDANGDGDPGAYEHCDPVAPDMMHGCWGGPHILKLPDGRYVFEEKHGNEIETHVCADEAEALDYARNRRRKAA